MIQLEVSDFVTRGWVTNIVLYHAQAPDATGAICNASHVGGDDDIDPIARRIPTDKNLSFESILQEH